MKLSVQIRLLCFLAIAVFSLCVAHTELFAGKRFPRIPRLKVYNTWIFLYLSLWSIEILSFLLLIKAFTRLTWNFRNRKVRANDRTNRQNDESRLELTKSGVESSPPVTLRDSPRLVYTTPTKGKSRVRTKRYYSGNRMGRQGVPESFISISVP